MVKHPQEETISAYMDGMLSVDDTRQIGEHVADCDHCRLVLRSLREVKQLLRTAPGPAALPESFWSDTLRRMRVGDTALAPPAPRFQWSLPRIAFAAGTAVLVLASILVQPAVGPNGPGRAGVAVAQQDNLDAADVAQFLRAHTESVANQPLADHNRQRLMSAEVASAQVSDNSSDVVGDADFAL